MVEQWPLVDREEDLRQMRNLITERDWRVGGLVLVGPSGVGKTRLALEGLRLAEADGQATLRLAATRAASDIPLGVLLPVLPALGLGVPAADDRADLLHRALAALVEHGNGRRVTLLVDDAHLLDDVCALFVQQAVMARAAFVLLVVLAGAPAPEPLVALWRDGLAARRVVRPLDPAHVEELVSTALGGPVDRAALVQLASRSRGNVLFLRELVVGAREVGSLARVGGLWRLRGELSPSDRLVELIRDRLDGLSGAEGALLELVAFGEPLGHAELRALSSEAVAKSLERRQLVTSSLDGRRLQLRLAHPLYGDVVREQVSAVRAREVLRSLAEAVEATGARRTGDTLRVASWRLGGGGGTAATLLAGAVDARWRYDFPLAERLARAAVAAGAGFDARLLAAELSYLQGRSDDAERALAALAGDARDDGEVARVAMMRVDNSVLWAGQHDLKILDDAQQRVTDPEWRDQLAARWLLAVLATHGPRACEIAARPLLSRASGPALVTAGIAAAWSLARRGRTSDAEALAERGRAEHLALTTPLAWYPWYHTATRAYALSFAGRFEEAERLASGEYEKALAERSVEAQGVFGVLLSSMVGDRGRPHTAVRRAREAVALFEDLDRPLMVRLGRTHLAVALALAGRDEEARQVLADLDRAGLPARFFNMVDTLQARAWVAACGGRLAHARRQLAEAADLGEELGDLVGTATALHAQARLGRPGDVHDRLAAVTAGMDGDLAPARTAHVTALVGGDAERLLRVSRRFAALGADLLAAEAAADAAVAYRARGATRQAAGAEREASAAADRSERPVTPALHAAAPRAELTPAERETALLAAAGRSNRAIATELHLSVRTVENRLHRTFAKLGVSSRQHLRDVLGVGHHPAERAE